MLQKLFLDHPRSVDESYLQHFAFALLFSIRLFGAAIAALVHALLPCAFEKTASKTVHDLYFKTHIAGPKKCEQRPWAWGRGSIYPRNLWCRMIGTIRSSSSFRWRDNSDWI